MSRIRTIKPAFFDDETIRDLPPEASLFFVNLLQHADDEGRFRWCAEQLGGLMFRDMGSQAVAGFLVQLHAANLIDCYAHDSQQLCGHIRNFARHQVISKPTPSRLPSPEADGSVFVAPPSRPVQQRKRRPHAETLPRAEDVIRWDDPDCQVILSGDTSQAPEADPHTANMGRIPAATTHRHGDVSLRHEPADPFTPDAPADGNTPGVLPERSRSTPGVLPEGSRSAPVGRKEGKGITATTTTNNNNNNPPPATSSQISARVRAPACEAGGEERDQTPITSGPSTPITSALSIEDRQAITRIACELAGGRNEQARAVARAVSDEGLWRRFDQARGPEYLSALWLAWGSGHPEGNFSDMRALASKLQRFLEADTPRHRLERLAHLARSRRERAAHDRYIPRNRFQWLLGDDWSDVPDPARRRAEAMEKARNHFLSGDDPLPSELVEELRPEDIEQAHQAGLEARAERDPYEGLPECCRPGYWDNEDWTAPLDEPPSPQIVEMVREERALERAQKARAAANKPSAHPEPPEPSHAQLEAARAQIREALEAGLPVQESLREALGRQRVNDLVRHEMQERLAAKRGAPVRPSVPQDGPAPSQEASGAQRGVQAVGEVIADMGMAGILAPGGDAE